MPKFMIAFLAGSLAFSLAQGAAQLSQAEAGTAAVPLAAGDSEHLEKSLQGLSWEQFRTVVNAIPKLKADVDAYGPLGWQYVQANYRSYPWRRSIDKLHEDQKKRLAELIGEIRDGSGTAN